MSDDLTALVFELQRAGSKIDKAKALARAWRTIRDLSSADRRLLAREVGFDGAEELIEGLAGKGRGVFAPAAVLEALGQMRRDKNLSLRGVLADLRDPEKRDDLLVRGIDLVAESVDRPDDAEAEFELLDDAGGFEAPDAVEEETGKAEPEQVYELKPPPIPSAPPEILAEPEIELEPEHGPEPEPDPARDPEPEPVREREPETIPKPAPDEPSVWDDLWSEQPAVVEAHVAAPLGTEVLRAMIATPSKPSGAERSPSVLSRLRSFRAGIEELRQAGTHGITDALESLPEPWARRRALVALIEAGIPDDPRAALDLIAELERPMDRRWCLSALARRGDLSGNVLDQALEMLESPAERRRVVALARG